jgi:PIN domain nuclease of toxin-antitoxin system
VKFLLDTHTLIWATLSRQDLSPDAANAIADPDNEILVSAASAWEIATKVRLNRLPEAVPLELRFLEALDAAGYSLLSIESATALRAGRLLGNHRDPFDRILAAHAIALDIPIISKDAKLDQFPIRRIW